MSDQGEPLPPDYAAYGLRTFRSYSDQYWARWVVNEWQEDSFKVREAAEERWNEWQLGMSAAKAEDWGFSPKSE